MSGYLSAVGQVYQFPTERMARLKIAGRNMSESRTKLISDHAVAKRNAGNRNEKNQKEIKS